ncbi:putative transcriptional regulatory [Hyphodiscus hymeniophilus]|uniref:Transcriptional regulatory n=1 Tax=Hyphodiscus hymeniophilus TaxID=353542 RepID=A0A9P6VQR9_9HELO|nr:putative transcriptional regulatory [Hyphodiscus hymeniophilus]
MSGATSLEPINRRQIRLDTQFGGARQSRSRKNRPCDICRNRKTACVIAVEPPCRLCTSRGLECSFSSKPKPKTRSNPQPIQPKTPVDRGRSESLSPSSLQQPGASIEYDLPGASPQESRFPVASRSLYKESDRRRRDHLPLNQLAAAASQIEGNSLDSTYSSDASALIATRDRDRNRRLSLLLTDDTEHSLEDSKDFTAHFIGLSGEQDTNGLASVRYNVLNETNFVDFNVRQVYPGDLGRGIAPIHFTILHDNFPERDQRAKRLASDAIERHVGVHGDVLVKLYFKFVHPILPILSKSRTLKSYATNKLDIPASLRGAVYGLACAFLTQDPTLKDVPPISQAVLFEHAHAAVNRELDSPKLSTLQACLLILHQQPEVNATTESPRLWALACQATACAQSLGLHQDPLSWKMAPWEKKLRKKLWWAVYLTDRWTSICHGSTPHILDDSFDTSDLDVEDLSCDENVTGLLGCNIVSDEDQRLSLTQSLRFLELVRLTRLLGAALKHGFTLQSYSDAARRVDLLARDTSLLRIWNGLNTRLSLLPKSLLIPTPETYRNQSPQLNCSLHLGFFVAKFLVLRALMSPATSAAKSDPTSNLRLHFNLAMLAGEQLIDFVAHMRSIDIYAFWPRQSRSNFIIAGNFFIYLFFNASTEEQVAKAHEMLQRYRDLLRSLAKSADWSTIGLIRPSLLRTESFFYGAAEGIRITGQK